MIGDRHETAEYRPTAARDCATLGHRRRRRRWVLGGYCLRCDRCGDTVSES